MWVCFLYLFIMFLLGAAFWKTKHKIINNIAYGILGVISVIGLILASIYVFKGSMICGVIFVIAVICMLVIIGRE